MVEGAALEMLCTEMYLGFESLTLRQEESCKPAGLSGFFFFCILAKTGHFGLDFGCSFHKSGKTDRTAGCRIIRHIAELIETGKVMRYNYHTILKEGSA